MKVGVLFPGDAQSVHALYGAVRQGWRPVLLSVLTHRPAFGFHKVANIRYLQAKAMEYPIVEVNTSGELEIEVEELRLGLVNHDLDGVLTGTTASEYVKQRVEQVSSSLNIEAFSPLWGKDPFVLLKDLVQLGFEVIFTKLNTGFDDSWVGRKIDPGFLTEIQGLMSELGAGFVDTMGAYETIVLDGPLFRRRVSVHFDRLQYDDFWYTRITHAYLI